jgi:hypothetical protein
VKEIRRVIHSFSDPLEEEREKGRRGEGESGRKGEHLSFVICHFSFSI